MKRLNNFLPFFIVLSCLTGCNGQTKNTSQSSTPKKTDTGKIIGGGCDGCEIMYVGMPVNIYAIDTSEGFSGKGQKLLLKGTVFKPDGKTPAAGVILYYWQTDNNGLYSPREGMDDKAKRHGHIRGWVKTDEKGEYSIYTIKPACYPNDNIPAHIHLSIKEPAIANEYYVDDLVFDDDKFLTAEKRKALENRGGSGILKLITSEDMQIANHDIILGLNIPNYPK